MLLYHKLSNYQANLSSIEKFFGKKRNIKNVARAKHKKDRRDERRFYRQVADCNFLRNLCA
nr:MAG TPA: hypothetical protein [Caudoviricetes sp.]